MAQPHAGALRPAGSRRAGAAHPADRSFRRRACPGPTTHRRRCVARSAPGHAGVFRSTNGPATAPHTSPAAPPPGQRAPRPADRCAIRPAATADRAGPFGLQPIKDNRLTGSLAQPLRNLLRVLLGQRQRLAGRAHQQRDRHQRKRAGSDRIAAKQAETAAQRGGHQERGLGIRDWLQRVRAR